MKSPHCQYRFKTESWSQKNIDSKSISRRLSTQPDSYFLNPEDSKVLRKASLSKKLFQNVNKANGNYFTESRKYTSENSTRQSHSKHNIELLSNMSTKPYGKVIAYGWSHLKSKEQGNQSVFDINLGKVKLFTIVETQDGKEAGKRICESYTIRMMKTIEEIGLNQIKEKEVNQAISLLRESEDLSRYKFSMVSVMIDQEKIMVTSLGGLEALCFTKKQQLINSSTQAQAQSVSTLINNSFNAVRTSRYCSSNRTTSRLYSSIKQTSSLRLPAVNHKIYKCSDVVWISIFSNIILQRCHHKYLKDCINKQFVLTSKSYPLGEAARESCRKIITDLMKEECHSSMTAIVILMDEYPFENDVNHRQAKGQPSIWGKMKSYAIDSETAATEPSKPKMLKYIGNRRSFVKNATQFPGQEKVK